jgi:hypothetical protein
VNARLERDLGAWANGELDRRQLLATHGSGAAGVVALHERLVGAAAATAVPDVEAGWASILAKLEAPAPGVPLRRHGRRRRTVPLLVAAALVAAGAAFAAIRGSTHEGPPSATIAPSVMSAAPASEVDDPNDRGQVPPPTMSAATLPPDGAAVPTGGEGGGSTGPSGSASDGIGGTGGSTSTDDPLDRDHGTGNDGSHDDNGSGNDGRSGTLPHGSHGQGH